MANENVVSVLEKELANVNNILLSLECGEIKPESLPVAPNFYLTKKERIEGLLWAYRIEERLVKNKVENAPNRDSGK